MKLAIVLLIVLAALSEGNLKAQSPAYRYVNGAGGTSSDYGQRVAVDAAGNSYVTGEYYSPSITFGSTTLTNAGGYDLFIVKYDVNGNVVWAKSAGGTNSDFGRGVAVDASGNTYIVVGTVLI